MSDASVYVQQLLLGPMQNFIYLIGDPSTREAAVVDPGWEIPKVLAQADRDGYRITRAILTHTHPDHRLGLPDLLAARDIPVHVHAHEAEELDVEPGAVQTVDPAAGLQIGALPVTVLHTPGHTPGSICLLVGGRLFSGDTLFINGCGRCDLPGGDPVQLYDSLRILAALDDSTMLMPGHHYADVPSITLGEEKQKNPFLRMPTLEAFLHMLGYA